jgi:hypothetical protein
VFRLVLPVLDLTTKDRRFGTTYFSRLVSRAYQRAHRTTRYRYLLVRTLKVKLRDLCWTGAISDSSTSKYRRRYWVVLSTVALTVSTLILAYCQDIASLLVDFFDIGAGDWDEKRKTWVRLTIQTEH